MDRGPILQRQLPWRGRLWPRRPWPSWSHAVLASLSRGCPPLEGRLPTCYSPVRRFTQAPKGPFSLDLHVLGAPLTFALSQDQTLQRKILDVRLPPGRSQMGHPESREYADLEGRDPAGSSLIWNGYPIQFSRTDAATPPLQGSPNLTRPGRLSRTKSPTRFARPLPASSRGTLSSASAGSVKPFFQGARPSGTRGPVDERPDL